MNKTIRNPATGHLITFLQMAEQTNGELLQILYAVEEPETKPAIPLHIHLQCAERFEVVAGELGVILDGERRVMDVGEQVSIPPRMPHTIWNAGEGELRFITVDLALVVYSLFIRLPNNESSVRLVVRYEPDLGLMLLIILLLTMGWGSVRSLWAIWRWRTGRESQ